ncbi:hypothetical protein ABE488_00775 [Luteimonas sp. TWI662]|uniref:hypothetical protein n=1 Tax=Luteimonas sp. TWI662 TaxID=3136789 RepID=UPI00320868F1
MAAATVEAIRQFELDAPSFNDAMTFARHVDEAIELAYQGIKLTEGGGLVQTTEAIAIDRAWLSAYRAAGYDVHNPYDLAMRIWEKSGKGG